MDKVISCIIAEDFPELNKIYSNILNHEADIEVLSSVFSGAELLDVIPENRPDVILMDIEMESPTAGISYCRQISRKYPDVKVVFLTGHEEEERIIEAFEAGAVDYILKTDSMYDIISSIRKAYNHEAPIHSYAARTIRRKMQEIGRYKEELQHFTRAFMLLTPAEVGVLKLLLQGYKQKDIADKKHIELVTVKTHVGRILKKFGSHRTRDVISRIRELDLEEVVMESAST